jgi:serine/threonine-protein kinase
LVFEVAPGTLMGKYRVEAPIGRGGSGMVYRATQTGPGGFNRSVALKMLRHQQDGASREMALFFREARIIATLSHRNVVQVFELAVEQGIYFLVMELVDGVTLSRLLGRGPMEPRLAVAVAVEINRALCYAHERGVIHRDIKPSNILVNGQGDVKVADFGLAKIVGMDPLSAMGEVLGTPGYMSPEQLAGLPATPRSDVYSLALVLLRMCTGQVPARSAAGELSASADPAPEAIHPAVARALEPDPERRPDSRELGEGLQEALARLATGRHIARLGEELAMAVRRVRQGPEISAREGNTVAAGGQNPFAPRVAVRPEAPEAVGRSRRKVALALVAAGALLIALLGAGAAWLSRARDERPQPRAAAPKVSPDHRVAAAVDARTDAAPRAARPPAPRSKRAARRHHRPRRKRARRPGGAGTLTVNSDPWSVVYLDGRRLGMTPLYRARVPAGSHRVRLVPAKGRRTVRQIDVAPGEHRNLGMILLR